MRRLNEALAGGEELGSNILHFEHSLLHFGEGVRIVD